MDVGVWIRVSTEDQAKGESPEHHELRAKAYAQMKSWNIVEIYHMEAVSGKTVFEHPITQRMLHDVATGRIKALIFSKLARLARNTKELLEFADRFQSHGADLVSLQESIDTSTPAGRLFYTIIAAMAQWEREEIAERVAASVPIRAKLGKPLGGAAPLGCSWVDKRLEINSEEAPVVIKVFETFRDQKKLLTTANILNQAGHRTRKGDFTATTIHRILTNPVYKGIRKANYSKSLGKDKAWRLKPEEEWVYCESPAIVDDKLWQECNDILLQRKGKRSKPPKEGRHLFSGLLFCRCGGKMYVSWKAAVLKYRCYSCGARIEERILLEEHLKALEMMVLQPEQIEQLSEEEKTIEEQEKCLLLLRKDLRNVERQVDDLIALWGERLLDKDTFKARFDPLRERKEQISKEIPRLEGHIDCVKAAHLGKSHMTYQAQTFAALWPSLTSEEKRMAIKGLVHAIHVEADTLRFVYYWLPKFSVTPQAPVNDSRIPRDSWQRLA